MLNDDALIAATVVKDAVANIIEYVEAASASLPGSDVDEFRREVNETVLAFIAHLIAADGVYDPRERAFLKLLVDFSQEPNAELDYLRRYTERWRKLEQHVPEFFRAAVESDVKNKTETARGIMQEIQIIGNNCSVTDHHFADVEKKVIRRYLRFLDNHLDRLAGDKTTWLEP